MGACTGTPDTGRPGTMGRVVPAGRIGPVEDPERIGCVEPPRAGAAGWGSAGGFNSASSFMAADGFNGRLSGFNSSNVKRNFTNLGGRSLRSFFS